MDKFVVSSSPFIRGTNDINKMFISLSIVLLFASIFGAMFFGINVLFVLLVSVAVSFLSECLYNLAIRKKFEVTDISFLVTGLLVGLTMPVKMPLYIVAISSFVASFISKMAFGGLGKNKFNPAIVGRVFAGVMASYIAEDLYSFSSNGVDYISLSQGGTNTIKNLLTGNAVGGIGTTCVILIVLGYVFLVYNSVIDWKIPILSIFAFFGVNLLFFTVEQSLLNLCSGSFLFVSVFMLTDPNTSPNTLLGKVLYCLIFGGLSAFLWKMGNLGENTVFVVLLFVDLFVPVMDKYFVFNHKGLGGYRNAYKN